MPSLLMPLHAWLWRKPAQRARILLRFAEVEADSGRHMVRASELTPDPTLRRLYLAHARDERRHAERFRQRGIELAGAPSGDASSMLEAAWLTPGERGLDDLRVEAQTDAVLLAFLHLSEKSAAEDFADYCRVLDHDPLTRQVFEDVLRDEVFHMNYTRAQLARLAPAKQNRLLWRARLSRLWKGTLRLSTALGGVFGTVLMTLQYFVLLPLFAVLARRSARREVPGWNAVAAQREGALDRQY